MKAHGNAHYRSDQRNATRSGYRGYGVRRKARRAMAVRPHLTRAALPARLAAGPHAGDESGEPRVRPKRVEHRVYPYGNQDPGAHPVRPLEPRECGVLLAQRRVDPRDHAGIDVSWSPHREELRQPALRLEPFAEAGVRDRLDRAPNARRARENARTGSSRAS